MIADMDELAAGGWRLDTVSGVVRLGRGDRMCGVEERSPELVEVIAEGCSPRQLQQWRAGYTASHGLRAHDFAHI